MEGKGSVDILVLRRVLGAVFSCRLFFDVHEPSPAGQGGASARGDCRGRSTMEVIPECLLRS